MDQNTAIALSVLGISHAVAIATVCISGNRNWSGAAKARAENRDEVAEARSDRVADRQRERTERVEARQEGRSERTEERKA